jgi:hypothetical protein
MPPMAFKLRMPDGLRESLDEAANQHGLSLNQEIVRRLHQSYDPRADVQPTTGLLGEALVALNQMQGKLLEVARDLEGHAQQSKILEIASRWTLVSNNIYCAINMLRPDLEKEGRPMSGDPKSLGNLLALYRDNPLMQGSFDEIKTRLDLARQAAASADADMSAIGPDGKLDKERLRQIMREVYSAHLTVGLLELRLCELADERMKQ